jgi:quinoprotein glucose dehydrogenase
MSPLGTPCNPPPWGVLTAVDLGTGRVLWEVRLGTTRDQAPFPMWLPLGAPNLGGSIATAGGLVFIGATTDRFLRAFDARTGERSGPAPPVHCERHADQLPAAARASSSWSSPRAARLVGAGDAVLAFALP